MTDFTKIRWAGTDCILVTSTDNHNPRIPLLILEKTDIDKILQEWENPNAIPNKVKEVHGTQGFRGDVLLKDANKKKDDIIADKKDKQLRGKS